MGFLFLMDIMIDGIYLLLGTNLGDKKSNLSKAKDAINKHVGKIIACSKTYETAAWGKTNQPAFLNEVVEVRTTFSPEEMLKLINQIERSMGRVRVEKWGERLIDIDILYYNDKIHNSEKLYIPHPGIPDRRFTLEPLVELNPTFKHPVLNKTNEELLSECSDTLEVKVVR